MTPSATLLPAAAVKGRLTIADVLTAAGIQPARGNRLPCPLHHGSNPQAFWFNAERFVCFNCGARGDVFELIHQLHHTSGFADSLRIGASIAGVVIDSTRLVDREELQRQTRSRRLRAALRKWREDRLNELAQELHDHDRNADMASFVLTSARNTEDEEKAWDLFGKVHLAREAAEWQRVRLESDNESNWLQVLDEIGGAG